MKVLLAIDGSSSSEGVVGQLNSLKLDKDAEIIVLSVVERIGPIMGEPYGMPMIEYQAQIENQNLQISRDLVKETKEKIKKQFDCYVKTEVILGSPKYEIVERSKDWNVDLIIIGSHGYHLWERVLLGSVSTFVAQHAECSVLIAKKIT